MKNVLLIVLIGLSMTMAAQPNLTTHPNLQVGDYYVPFANSEDNGEYLVASVGTALHSILEDNNNGSVIDWSSVSVQISYIPLVGNLHTIQLLLNTGYVPTYLSGGPKLCCLGHEGSDYCWSYNCSNCDCEELNSIEIFY